MIHEVRELMSRSVIAAVLLLCHATTGCSEGDFSATHHRGTRSHDAAAANDAGEALEVLGPELALVDSGAGFLLLDDPLVLEGFFRVRPEYGGEMSERRPTVRDVKTKQGNLHMSGQEVAFSETVPEEYWVEPERVTALIRRVQEKGLPWERGELFPAPTLCVMLAADGRVSFHPQNVPEQDYGTTAGTLIKGERAQRYLVTGPDPDPAWMIIDGVPPLVDGALRADFASFLGPVTASFMTLGTGESSDYRLALVEYKDGRLAVCSARRRTAGDEKH